MGKKLELFHHVIDTMLDISNGHSHQDVDHWRVPHGNSQVGVIGGHLTSLNIE